jgi:hypothetical protein
MTIKTGKIKRHSLPAPPIDGNPALEAPPPAIKAVAVQAPTASEPVADRPRRLDGRSLRATHRTAQINLKVTAETRDAFLRIAERRGILMAELFEEAVRLLEDSK